MIERALARFAQFVLAHRRAAGALCVLVTAAAAAALSSFRLEPDVRALFPREHEAMALFDAVHPEGKTTRTMLLLLRGDDLDDALPAYVERLRASPFLAEVAATRDEVLGAAFESAPLLTSLSADALDELESRLVGPGRREALEESRALLAQDPLAGREIVLRDPLGLRWLLASAERDALPESVDVSSPYLLVDGGRLAIVRVVGEREPTDVDFSNALLADVEGRLAGLDVRALGGYAVARADAARIRGDMRSSLVWSVPLVALFLAVSTRRPRLLPLLVLPAGLAVVWTLGFGGLALGPLTPLAISATAILIGLGVDHAVHWLERYGEERAAADAPAAIARTQGATARALLGAALTSSAAFLSVGFGSFSGLRDFGILLAGGLVLALVATWIVLPLLVPSLDPGPAPARPGLVARGAHALASSRAAGPLAAAFAAAALGGWALVALHGLSFDADPAHLRPADTELERAARELAVEIGFWPFGVVALVPAQVPLADVADALDALASESLVARTAGVHASIGAAERRGRIAAFRERTQGWVGGALADVADVGLAPEPFRGALEDLAERLEREPELGAGRVEAAGRSYWRATLFLPPRPSTAAERDALRERLSAGVGAPVELVDSAELARRLGAVLAGDLARAVLACAVVVVLLSWLAVGSLAACAAALAPAFAGLGIVLGMLSLFGWPLTPGNFVAVPLVLGLGVDDGIHMVRRLRESGLAAIRTTGAAVWRTSACTALGFGSLVTAETPAIASLGAIVLLGTATCFCATILILPRIAKRT